MFYCKINYLKSINHNALFNLYALLYNINEEKHIGLLGK